MSELTTAVTCPTMRIHPAGIARGAATAAVLLDGRFALGVGSGEALNEHIFGDAVVCGPDIERHVAALQEYADAGFDELYVNQIGPDQKAFFAADSQDLPPRLR